MADRNEDFIAALLCEQLFDPATDRDAGPARRGVGRFDLLPRHAAAPTGAQRFEERLLDGEPAGQVQIRIAKLEAVGPLDRREDPCDESFSPACDRRLDSCALDNIGADSQNRRRRRPAARTGYLTSSFISVTARSMPICTARVTMEWPMLNSTISFMAATRLTFR